MAKGATVIQLYGVTDADNIANVDMPDDGFILSAHIDGVVTAFASDSDAFRYELSFGSTSQFTTNDARSVIAIATASVDLGGAAANLVRSDIRSDCYFGQEGIPVFAGERIYLHGSQNGAGLNAWCRALLVIRFHTFTPRRR